MAKEFFWKVWLRLNPLTKDVDNDYIAEISTILNTVRNEDIARQIVKTGSEESYETILSILGRRDNVVRDTLLGGTSVQDDNFRYAPAITGTFVGTMPHFDPEKHKIHVNATATTTMRRALDDQVGVDFLGVKADGGARIALVTDLSNGWAIGSVHSGEDILIEGEKIKIAPLAAPNRAADPVGVFFVPRTGAPIPLDHAISENTPTRIICRVPAAVKNDRYTLKIVTRYSTGNRLLDQPREIVYDKPISEGVVSSES